VSNRATAIALGLLLWLPATAGAAPVGPAQGRRLSNERTVTVWAHPARTGPIYSQPTATATRTGHVHLLTEDRFPEVYLLLDRRVDEAGHVWIKLRIPGRPNGRVGWVRKGTLGALHTTHWQIVVNLRQRRLRAYFMGALRFTVPVGVGKPSTPTPPGHFWIRERFHITNRSNPFWPYALGTSDYSTLTEWPGGGVVGIHGDLGAPSLIPGAPSHGCVRLRDRDIAWLAPRVSLGTPVWIRP
jgi:lipoprotein-anchoring transpeptidase ErfK/SrfK